MAHESSEEQEKPWHAAYPSPRCTAGVITRSLVLRRLHESQEAGQGVILVDLRRNDHEGGTINGSINLPAQSLYPTIPTLYRLFEAAKVETVIWYCGSSSGRGPRAAAWFQDCLDEQKNSTMKSLVLEGGIKGWAKAGEEYTQLMKDYDARVWNRES